jgi:head-tail adaptor
MRAGPLRDRVSIHKQRSTQDAGGGLDVSYEVVASGVPAEITPLSGRERVLAGQMGGTVSHRISLRYYRGLSIRHRLSTTTHGATREFGILAVLNPDGRQIEHLCDVAEVV